MVRCLMFYRKPGYTSCYTFQWQCLNFLRGYKRLKIASIYLVRIEKQSSCHNNGKTIAQAIIAETIIHSNMYTYYRSLAIIGNRLQHEYRNIATAGNKQRTGNHDTHILSNTHTNNVSECMTRRQVIFPSRR